MALALLALQACTVSRLRPKDLGRTSALPALNAADLLAPIEGTPKEEIQALDAMPAEPTVRLRRTWVQLSTGDDRHVLRELNRMLYGEPAPTREVEAWALYMRALFYAKKGDTVRQQHDLASATRLTTDRELAKLVAAASRPSDVATPRRSRGIAQHLARQEWGASAPRTKGMVPMRQVERITLHHSAMTAHPETLGRTGDIVRSIQKNHMQDRGWSDIGYHYIIDREGRVWDGRKVDWQGAHAGNPTSNRGNVGICLLGNFVSSSDGQQPSPEQLAAMEALVYDLCQRYRIPASRILTHREIKPTACPGGRLQAAVEHLRSAMLGRGGDGMAQRASQVADS